MRWFVLISLLVAALSVVAFLSVVPNASAGAESIEAFIDREMPAAGVPGLAYAVVSDGEIELVGARGVLELGGDEAVTPDTAFVTGSISKSFTALAVVQLVEAGKIGLDTELSRYLAVFSDRRAGTTTIRQLLSHTSGFSTLQGNASQWDVSSEHDDLASRVDRLAHVVPAYQRGKKWEYSNANYQILGRVIEVVSGQKYGTYVESHILEPAGMDHSYVADGKQHDAMATGHRSWFGTHQALTDSPTSPGTAPQGGIIASASDLARYMRLMMNGEDDIVSAESKAEMMRPASHVSPSYGFGWFIDSDNGSVWHAGASPGFETLATLVPAEKKGVVCWSTAAAELALGKRRSSARASPPRPWASTTAVRGPDFHRKPCSSV